MATPSPCEILRSQLRCEEGELVGESPAHHAMLRKLVMVARRQVRVLLTGPTGVGKTTVAQVLHRASGRKGKFVPTNAAQLPASLADSRLFGHEKGAFTDAHQRSRGLVERAHGGTLFIDEVAELEPAVQAKLLTFLDNGVYQGLGLEEQTADVRLITATNRDLSALRSDLLWRLAEFPIAVPSLDERPGDIPMLAEALLCRMAREEGVDMIPLSMDAEEALLARTWPGNVRELRGVLRIGDIHARYEGTRRICARHLSPEVELDGAGSWEEREAAWRRVVLRSALREKGDKVEEAARLLGIKRSTFYKWMADLGLSAEERIVSLQRGRRVTGGSTRPKRHRPR